ncbi:MAG: MarR family winged helix-turn-helix transcriptional regulator [Mycobacteriales bacterium]
MGQVGEAGSGESGELADRLRVILVRAGRQLRRQDPDGLNVTLYSALATIADQGELAIGELASAEYVPSSAATRMADQLEGAGYVTRGPNPHDRRGVILSVTAEGRRVVERRRQHGNVWLARRLARLSPADRSTVTKALDVLEHLMFADEERAETTLGSREENAL